MTKRGFKYVRNRLTSSLFDIQIDGAEKSKDDFFRKLKIVLDDEAKEEWNTGTKDLTLPMKYEYEDVLPDEISQEEFNAMYEASKVDIVRMYPYIEIEGRRYYLRSAL